MSATAYSTQAEYVLTDDEVIAFSMQTEWHVAAASDGKVVQSKANRGLRQVA